MQKLSSPLARADATSDLARLGEQMMKKINTRGLSAEQIQKIKAVSDNAFNKAQKKPPANNPTKSTVESTKKTKSKPI